MKLKPIPLNPKYFVSNDGRVFGPTKQMAFTFGHGSRYLLCRIPVPGIKKDEKGSIKFFAIHQLVAELFIGPKPFPDAVVMHLDDVKTNNNDWNLKYGTKKENFSAVQNTKILHLLRAIKIQKQSLLPVRFVKF